MSERIRKNVSAPLPPGGAGAGPTRIYAGSDRRGWSLRRWRWALAPGWAAEIDVARAGQGAGRGTGSTAEQRAAKGRAAGQAADRRTAGGADRTAAQRAVTARIAAGRKAQRRGSDCKSENRLPHGRPPSKLSRDNGPAADFVPRPCVRHYRGLAR